MCTRVHRPIVERLHTERDGSASFDDRPGQSGWTQLLIRPGCYHLRLCCQRERLVMLNELAGKAKTLDCHRQRSTFTWTNSRLLGQVAKKLMRLADPYGER
jgi:hypothetical protein